jgi:hypothetical protein
MIHYLYPCLLCCVKGENDIDQLYLVISSLGTPTESSWPGRTELPDYNKITFRKMKPIPISTLVPSDVPKCTEFLGKFLLYDSTKRIPAKDVILVKKKGGALYYELFPLLLLLKFMIFFGIKQSQ